MNTRTKIVIVASALIGVALGAAQASWLSKISGVHVNPSAGRIKIEAPQPQAIPDMLKHLPKDATQFLLNPAGSALAEAIRISRNRNIGKGRVIPLAIRAQLTPYFPAKILDRVRFTTTRETGSLPGIINTLRKAHGFDAVAVTLDDLIIFTGDTQATDEILWAHELMHVVQYDNMGVESFANVYSTGVGGRELEQQATDWAQNVKNGTGSASVTPAYSVAANALHQQNHVSPQAWQSAARQYIPPATCVQWNYVPGGVKIVNVCPVGIEITSVHIVAPNGFVQITPCPSNCSVSPNGGWNLFNTGGQRINGGTFVFR